MSSSNSFFSQGSEIYGKRKLKDCKNQRGWMTPRRHLTDAHMDSQRLWQHPQDLHRFKSGSLPGLTKKLFATDTCKQRENQFSVMKYHLVYQSYSKTGSMIRSSWSTQKKLHVWGICFAFVMGFCLFLTFFCLIGVVFEFHFCVIFEKDRRENIKLSRWGGSGRRWGGESTIKIYCKEKCLN